MQVEQVSSRVQAASLATGEGDAAEAEAFGQDLAAALHVASQSREDSQHLLQAVVTAFEDTSASEGVLDQTLFEVATPILSTARSSKQCQHLVSSYLQLAAAHCNPRELLTWASAALDSLAR